MQAGLPLVVLTLLCAIIASRFKREKWVVFWFIFSGIVHILLEGSYGFHNTEIRTKATTTFMEKMLEDVPISKTLDTHWWAGLYGQYARYDARYTVSDPLVVFFCWTELVEGVLCFLLAALIGFNSIYRHPTQLICSTAQFYGTVLYFLAPVFYGTWDTVITKDPFELWVYVLLLNGLWMVVPALLIIQSFRALSRRPPSDSKTKKRQ